MPFSRQTRSKEHLYRRPVEPAGEHLAVVGQDLGRNPVRTQGLGQSVAHVPRGLPHHQGGLATQYREWSSTPDNTLARVPISQHEPTDHIHLPQLHRRTAFPPLPLAGPAAADRPGSIRPNRTSAR